MGSLLVLGLPPGEVGAYSPEEGVEGTGEAAVESGGMVMSDDLAEFLLARVDEDEQVARDAAGVPWSAQVPGMIHVDADVIRANKHAYGQLGYVATVEREGNRAHIARWDPARVLAECEARRRIVQHIAEELEDRGCGNPWWYPDKIEPVLRLLALPYRDHPDYRSEWGEAGVTQ